ncbi:MAG TPA: C4-dicarboxylate TRAP transporter substrate-binding protein [Paenalcaligenes sp.]|nr:C4-dicarboxylate TRAP transporter substrate-binding protein [Paenalcaligenes sp.]
MFKSKLFAAAILATSVVTVPLAASAAPVTIKVAYENHPGEPTDKVMNYWADLLEERSDGEIILELYPSSQLGSKGDVMDQAMMGMNVVTITDVGFLADYEPDLSALYGPFLAENSESLLEIYESPWFEEKNQALKDQGVHLVITNYNYGDRHIIAKSPIRTPEDLQGLKIRVPDNPIQIKAFEAMGATPTPMPLADVYPALTQGVIDGAENPLSVLYGQKLHEPAKYLSLINYLTTVAVWMGGEAFFSTLPEEQLQLIHETGYEAGLYSQELAKESEEEFKKLMQEEGVEIIEPDREAFKEKAMQVYEQFPEWSPNLYETLQEQLK